MQFARFSYIFLLLLLMVCGSASGQIYPEKFGKNRVQYKDMHWKLVRTHNFDVYYYTGGLELAQLAAKYAEEDFDDITSELGFFPYSKVRLIIYNSSEDLLQSNIGLESEGVLDAGLTNFVKLKVEIPFTGNQSEFRKQVRYHIARNLLTVMMYGGTLKDVVQSSYMLSLSEWFVEGAAAYIAEGWSNEMDDKIRNLIFEKHITNPEHLTGTDARIVGQSIWNYIAMEYGESTISNILNLTRILRQEESSIANSLGTTYEGFIEDWIRYYRNMTLDVQQSYQKNDTTPFVSKKSEVWRYNYPIFNPEGNLLAYVRNYNGRYDVMIADLETGKTKKLFRHGYKTLDQEINYEKPSISWVNDEELAIIGYKAGILHRWNIHVLSGKKAAQPLEDFSQVLDFDYSDDGRFIVYSATKVAQSDIYLYDTQKGSMRQITNDLYDDISPHFVGKHIAFSSNRLSDTLKKDTGHYGEINDDFDIFIYRNQPVLQRISTGPQKDIQPAPYKNGLVFLSESKGIYNLYRYNFADNTIQPLTEFSQNIYRYDFSKTGSFTYLMYQNGRKHIFCLENPLFETKATLLPTPRIEKVVPPAPVKKPKPEKIIKPDTILPDTLPTTDSIPAIEDTLPALPTDSLNIEKEPTDTIIEDTVPEDAAIDIYNYRFGELPKMVKEKKENPDKVTPPVNYEQFEADSLEKAVLVDAFINGPFDYRPSVSVNSATTALMIDPLRGLGVLIETDMSDMFVNHKLKLGLFGNTDLRSSNFYAEYDYLKKRIDFGIRFDRELISAIDDNVWQKYSLNKFTVKFAYPLSVKSRIAFHPFYAHSKFNNLIPLTAFDVDDDTDYLGGKLEFVYDNTISNGPNMLEGMRLKGGIESYTGYKKKEKNFNRLYFDIRNYQRIHRNIIFASRFSYGKFFGNAPKDFLLGGMDNWLFSRSDLSVNDNPLDLDFFVDNSDLLFNKYVTPMRGFEYNRSFGNNYMLLNFELRIPIARYINNGPVSSSFLSNLQIIAFTDVGTTWQGGDIFPVSNNKKIDPINSNPFSGTVEYFTQPFISGHGLGLRTIMLGYYTKFDVAWGLEDFTLQSPVFYLTFGHDF